MVAEPAREIPTRTHELLEKWRHSKINLVELWCEPPGVLDALLLASEWHLDERCWWQARLLDMDLDQEGDWTAQSTSSLNSLIIP